MTSSPDDRDGGPGLVDIHNHFVPGVDDGARSVEEALTVLRELARLGISRVATTPHISASRVDTRRRTRIEESFAQLHEAVAESIPELTLSLGFEVRLDEPDADLSDRELGLGPRHLLVEFSMLVLPAYPVETLAHPARHGWVPVLAHPERYLGVGGQFHMLDRCRDTGVVMCVNAGSLLGLYGREPERVARRMLATGTADVIASDNHARPGRSENLRSIWDRLREGGFEDEARMLLSENPMAVLEGRDPRPVPPIELSDRWMTRLKRLVRRSR